MIDFIKKFLKNYFNYRLETKRELFLENKLKELEEQKLEDYIKENFFIDTTNGFELKFYGRKFINILTSCFWELVKDSENYLVMTYKSVGKPHEGVDVIIVKEGKLTPIKKLKSLEEENKRLKKEFEKLKKGN